MRAWRIVNGQRVELPNYRHKQARGPCEHLGKRTEFRAGCGGNMCRHECEAGEKYAIPGGNCQTCPKWEG